MKLIELMFCPPQTELAKTLVSASSELWDLEAWEEMTEVQKADLFGKMAGARQAIEHCCRVNFGTDASRLPIRLDDVCGVQGVKPWNLPPVFIPEVNGSFLNCIEAMLGVGQC